MHSPTQLFIKAIENEIRQNVNIRFFLATDDAEEEKAICKTFIGRILCRPKKSLDRNCPEGIIDALADLYYLSKCSKVIASYGSSFSDVAAEWGNIEKITIDNQNK